MLSFPMCLHALIIAISLFHWPSKVWISILPKLDIVCMSADRFCSNTFSSRLSVLSPISTSNIMYSIEAYQHRECIKQREEERDTTTHLIISFMLLLLLNLTPLIVLCCVWVHMEWRNVVAHFGRLLYTEVCTFFPLKIPFRVYHHWDG